MYLSDGVEAPLVIEVEFKNDDPQKLLQTIVGEVARQHRLGREYGGMDVKSDATHTASMFFFDHDPEAA